MWRFGVSLLALAAGGAIAFFVAPNLGGVPPTYEAYDRDPRLTLVAREAAPLVRAVDRFYAAHRTCPRASGGDVGALQAELGPAFVVLSRGGQLEFRPRGAPVGWIYYSPDQNPASCSLSKKLGWDPSLVWRRDGDATWWVFVPGDGSAERRIQIELE